MHNVTDDTLVAPADGQISEACRKVAHDHARIEVTLPDGAGHCVIISKDELQALEQALEILADGDGMKAACGSIDKLCNLWREQIQQ